MVAILDEYSTGFLRDVGGLISGAFNFVEFLLGVSFFCGQKLTEWIMTAGLICVDFFGQVFEILKVIGFDLWDFGGSVVRGFLLIYYGVWMIFEAFYITAVDLKSVTIHVFTSVGQLFYETQVALTHHSSSAYTKVPKHVCDAFSFVGKTTIGLIEAFGHLLQDFSTQLVLAPINVIQAIGSLLYKVACVPVQAYPHIPITAHVGFAVVMVICTMYWKFSILSMFRNIPSLIRYIYSSMCKVSVVVRNFKRISEETIQSGGSLLSRSPPKGTIALCVICKDATVTIISQPCRHVCLCYSCAQTLIDFDNRCPLCRGRVTQYEKVYIPL